MKITQLTTKDGANISLGDFTVLVGPNNVGKSQTLRDIHAKTVNGLNARTTIIESIQLEKPESFDELLVGLKVSDHPNQVGAHLVRGIQPNLVSGDTLTLNLEEYRRSFASQPDLNFILGNLSRFRVSYLDASSRLQVAQSVSSYNPHTNPPQNLLQGLFGGDLEEEDKLREVFKATFGMDIRLDYSGMTELSLRVAKEFSEIPDDPRKAFPILSKFSRLDEQGDGFRSFVGVVLSLILSKGRIILLDEPEAFLHPAQARQLGYWIAEHSRTALGQIVIATHNANFLSGILSSEQSVNIYRLNRSGDNTTYTLIASDATSNLAKSPLLSSQRVLEAIFYRGVIVCEADADRAVYHTVASKEHETQDFLFVHAHNKQTIPKVVRLLKDAGIPVCAITDIDVLNSSDDLSEIVVSLASSPNMQRQLLDLRERVATAIEGLSEDVLLTDLQDHVREFLSQMERREHGLSGARGALNRIRQSSTKWSIIKQGGINAVPNEARSHATELIAMAKEVGLFIVPVGELESWLNLGTSQKNKWIVFALEALHAGLCSPELQAFIGEVLSFLGYNEI